ncbi:MAG: GNAT family N-acetyltransferase [Lachnospiraceae bacterium]|nr:GNAT family N-acetyltransferase [Lachnospiraceae bacterium]
MEIRRVTYGDRRWNDVKDYAGHCSWRAGKSLASLMEQQMFSEWEGVIAAFDQEKICGYCTVSKTDCIPEVSYTPYIGYVFVGEEYRGKRLSQKLIENAMEYLKTVGFEEVYLISDHENLYEKYGFEVIDRRIAPWGTEEKIYFRRI